AGSQLQANPRSIQGELEKALGSLTGETVRVALAGRTDSGVHAKGQVAAFGTHSGLPLDALARGANALLPLDISVRSATEVPSRFAPRGRAVGRSYRYTLHLAPRRPALLRQFAWHVAAPLDLAAMAEAARLLLGSHDFASFTRPSGARRGATQRRVTRVELRQK